MSEEKRRALFERMRVKVAEAGLKLESDPEFLANIELWISGEIDMTTLRGDYLQLLFKKEDAAWMAARKIRQRT